MPNETKVVPVDPTEAMDFDSFLVVAMVWPASKEPIIPPIHEGDDEAFAHHPISKARGAA